MALWMTVEQECFGLAVLLLVFSCAFWYGCESSTWGRGNARGRLAAFFVVLWIGAVAGCGRMEYEEWRYREEQKVLRGCLDTDVMAVGRIVEIQEMDYGLRLVLWDCEVIGAGEETEQCRSGIERQQTDRHVREARGNQQKVRKLYCYMNERGDGAGTVMLGTWVKVSGSCELPEPDRNPGGFDYRLYCFSKGICGTVNVEEVSGLGEEVHRTWPDIIYWRFRENLRQFGILLESKIEQIAEPEDAGILKAILLGVKTDMSDDVYELYRRNGISHLLAISGLHVSVIGKGLWNLLRKLGLGYTGAGSAAFLVLLVYGTLIGFGPSVVRAVFMTGVSFLASVYGRTYDLPSAMCVPAIGLLLHQPYYLTQAGVQLSFLAVGAMFFPGTYLVKGLEAKGAAKAMLISVSLQIAALPAVLWHSYETPLYGMLLNFVAVPLMTYVLVSGILGVIGSFLWSGIGTVCVGGAHYILWLYQSMCIQMLKVPGANMVLGRPEWWELFFYYGCMLAGTWMAGRKRIDAGKEKRRTIGWLGLWMAGILVLIPRPQQGLSVTFLDVGQGDGIFLEAGTKTMLVDCGSSQERALGEEILIPYLKSRGVTRIDAVVVTHGDFDHVSGIRYLLEQGIGERSVETCVEIGCLILPEAAYEDETCAELADLARRRDVDVLYCGVGDSLRGLLGNEIRIDCLHPGEIMREEKNERSLVLDLEYGQFRLLLTGDAGIEAEQEMMRRHMIKPVTILKAGHHGSNTSTSVEFLETVCPRYVIISYGKGNSYGHPAPAVMERCRKIGAEIYETARSGAVTVWTDGENMKIAEWVDS